MATVIFSVRLVFVLTVGLPPCLLPANREDIQHLGHGWIIKVNTGESAGLQRVSSFSMNNQSEADSPPDRGETSSSPLLTIPTLRVCVCACAHVCFLNDLQTYLMPPMCGGHQGKVEEVSASALTNLQHGGGGRRCVVSPPCFPFSVCSNLKPSTRALLLLRCSCRALGVAHHDVRLRSPALVRWNKNTGGKNEAFSNYHNYEMLVRCHGSAVDNLQML